MGDSEDRLLFEGCCPACGKRPPDDVWACPACGLQFIADQSEAEERAKWDRYYEDQANDYD